MVIKCGEIELDGPFGWFNDPGLRDEPGVVFLLAEENDRLSILDIHPAGRVLTDVAVLLGSKHYQTNPNANLQIGVLYTEAPDQAAKKLRDQCLGAGPS